MPYNPNDPNSSPDNPENHVEGALAHVPENPSVEDKVRCCFPHVMIRNQPPECEATVAKMQDIFFDRRDGKITKEECAERIAALRAGDIATWITDGIALHFVNIACDAILEM